MPIEIRELSIKVNVREDASHHTGRHQRRENGRQQSTIMEECLEQVADMIKNKKER